MATKHWVRDVLLTDDYSTGSSIANGNQTRAWTLLYHFLRNAGFGWLWECDGEGGGGHALNPNRVLDGNMETAGTANWTATGTASIEKVTSPVGTGTQALKVTPGPMSGGVRSAVLTDIASNWSGTGLTGCSLSGPDVAGVMTYDHNSNITNTSWLGREFVMSGSTQSANNGSFPIVGVPGATLDKVKFYNPGGIAESYTTGVYEVAVSSKTIYSIAAMVSNAGSALTVSVDRGDGTPVSVGTIPNNGGVPTLYRFSFSIQGTGSVYVYIENLSGGAVFYVDSLMVFRSMFEYYSARDEAVSGADPGHYVFTNNLAVNHYGVDGILTNPDRFSTGTGDSYSPGAHDIGKHLIIWDATNNKNSGIYRIIADIGGGVVQVDLRSGSAAFVAVAGGLKWRIVNVNQTLNQGLCPNVSMPNWQQSAGFGIESPHSKAWRFFMRNNQSASQTQKCHELWGAPEDTDFNQSTGHFWKSGPSVMRNRVLEWVRDVSAGVSKDIPYMHLTRGPYALVTPIHSRLFMITDANLSFIGFLLWDVSSGSLLHSCFVCGYHDTDTYHPGIMSWVLLARWEHHSDLTDIAWDGEKYRFASRGTSFDADGMAVECTAAQLQMGTGGGGNNNIVGMSNAGSNPWSSEEVLLPLRIVNDRLGYVGQPTERDGWGLGVYQGRANRTNLTAFDSNNYLHFISGLVWEWMGESILP
jgi:hypothetical protein